jgi:peroxiredoxin
VRDRLDELGESTEVVLITFTDIISLTEYQWSNELPYPVLTDPRRETYRAYGLGRGSVRRVWGTRATKRYIELVRESGLGALRKPTEDTLQLGGDFVIGPDGNLAWGFWGDGPDDRPSVDDLVIAVRDATT